MSKKKKVLFVATVVKKHINVFHLPYLQWFQEQGYETHVCARDDFYGEECIIPYCDVHYDIPFERSPVSANNVKAYKELKRIIDENEYDIIHCHTPVAAMLTRLAAIKARKKGTKVIYTAHGFHFFKGAPLINWLIYYPVEWVCSWFTDVLITMNREDYQLAKKRMKAKKIEYMYGVGINRDKFTKIQVDKEEKRKSIDINENDFMIISVGELNKNKNHQVIIQAIAKLRNEKIKYILCGQGPLETELRELSIGLGIENQVKFLGFRRDIPHLMKGAELFVFPSYREGLSLSLMEAMASGLPVICSKIRGNTDLIENGIGGYLVDPGNVLDIVEYIQVLISNEGIRKKMKDSNIENIKRYDILNVITQYKKIICGKRDDDE